MIRKRDELSDTLQKEIMNLISTTEKNHGVFLHSLSSKKNKDGKLRGFKVNFIDENSDAVDDKLLDSKSLGEEVFDLISDFEVEHSVNFKSNKSMKSMEGKIVDIIFSFEGNDLPPEQTNIFSSNTNPSMFKKYHLQEQKIPAGFEIYDERLEVAGIQHRRDAAAKFVEQAIQWVEFESEPLNNFDSNAMKILGCYQQDNDVKKLHVGYVPARIAKQINSFSVNECIPRLLKTYIGNSGYVEILIQVLGPKGRIEEYASFYEPTDEDEDED